MSLLNRPKYIIFFLVCCYSFSLGIFTASTWERIQSRKKLLSQIGTLNKFQEEKTSLLKEIQENIKDKPEWSMVKKHLLAMEQISQPFTETEVISQMDKTRQLRPFFINFLKNLEKAPLDSESFLLVLNLQSLELKIMDSQSIITRTLIDQADADYSLIRRIH